MKRLLKFEAPWCTKCKQMDAIMETMDIPYVIERVNVDENMESTLYYGIKGIPHMILLDENNNVLARVGGAVSKQVLAEALELE